MRSQAVGSEPWRMGGEADTASCRYLLRWLLTHVVVKNILNPLTLCAAGVSVLYLFSESAPGDWIHAGGIYLATALGVPIAVSITGVRKGWLKDPLAPRAELRPLLYGVNAASCVLILILMENFSTPPELQQVCLIHFIGMILLGSQTWLTTNYAQARFFKASMHVFAAAAISMLVLHHYLMHVASSLTEIALAAMLCLSLVLFVAWGRVCHVPRSEHTWGEALVGACCALLALLCALLLS